MKFKDRFDRDGMFKIRFLLICGYAFRKQDVSVVDAAENDVRITYINGEYHGWSPFFKMPGPARGPAR